MTKNNCFKYTFKYLQKNLYFIIPLVLIVFGIFLIIYYNFYYHQMKITDIDPMIAEQIHLAGERRDLITAPMQKGEKRNYVSVNNKLVPIFMYHHIRDYSGNNKIEAGLSVSPALFSKQIDWFIQNGFHTITFSDLFTGEVEDKSVILTFDDGYRDNYDIAYRKLKDSGLKGEFFVFSSAVTSPNYLTKEMIKEMSDNGMEFGSHTVNHIDMSNATKAILEYQLISSKSTLESITGKKVEYLCYPSGKFNALAEEVAKAAGYKAAVTTRPYADSANLFELPRIRMNPTTSVESLKSLMKSYLYASDKYIWSFI